MDTEIRIEYRDLPIRSTHEYESEAELVVRGSRSLVMLVYKLIHKIQLKVKYR